MVRALGVLLNTAQAYHAAHAVFERAVEERMPLFDVALKGAKEISLFISDNTIRYGTVPLDPELRLFKDLAGRLTRLKVSGLTWLPGLSAEDLKTFVRILTTEMEAIESQGLQPVLDQEHIRSIRELKRKLGYVDEQGKTGAAPGGIAGTTAKPAPRTHAAKGTWEIDLGGDQMEEEHPSARQPEEKDEAEAGGGTQRVFHSYVRDVLTDLQHAKASPVQAADRITTRFNEILTEKVEEVKRESAGHIRRLTTIKDMVLKDLEMHHLAAIVCDHNMNVLAANTLGRKVTNNQGQIPKGSALEQFVASRKERSIIDIDGVPRVAHMILSVEPLSSEGAMLISIE